MILRSLSCLTLAVGGAALTASIATPLTASVVAGGLMTGAAANFFHDLLGEGEDRLLSAIFRRASNISEHHHILLALRQAHLTALGKVLAAFDEARASDPDVLRRSKAEEFAREVKQFLTDAGIGKRAGVGAPTQFERDVFASLPEAFDSVLAAHGAWPPESAIGSAEEARGRIEAAVIDELLHETGRSAAEVPALFCSAFYGRPQHGWFDFFVGDGAARLKANEEFRSIWTAEKIARINHQTARISASLERVAGDLAALADAEERRFHESAAVQEAHGQMLAQLLSIARAGGAFQRAADAKISEAAVRAIVERLGGKGIGPEDLLSWLDSWIKVARRQLHNQTDEGEALEPVREEAARRFRSGQIADASSAFMEEYQREQEAEAARQVKRTGYRSRLIEEAIAYDELAFDGEAAAQKLRLMGSLRGVSGRKRLGEWLSEQAHLFHTRGKEKGPSGALVLAISAYRESLKELSRDRFPFEWAARQADLGVVLQDLGERESGTLNLEEAVRAFRTAQTILTRKRLPAVWAVIQAHLATTLGTLGERERNDARLEQAVAACHAALEVQTEERDPRRWAVTQSRLGTVLQVLGQREDGSARLEEAVIAFHRALNTKIRQHDPRNWAMIQNNLGNTLRILGERERSVARMQGALDAFRAAAEEFTRERTPLDWAMTQANVGGVLLALGVRERGKSRFEEAILYFEEALKEFTYERATQQWAMVQINLGTALGRLAAGEPGTKRLENAVEVIRKARNVFESGRATYYVDVADNNLAALSRLLARRQKRGL
jgi:tetratricopeptide (TPR) repeat protein